MHFLVLADNLILLFSPATMSNNSSDLVSLPTNKELVLKVIPMPADCNANGDIFGGWVMAQVDLAGAVLPARHTSGRMATVAVNEFVFKQPVRLGDILSFFSEVVRVGRTSVTVRVEVFAERFRSQGSYIKVTEAQLVYVAIDNAGKPTPLDLVPAKSTSPTDSQDTTADT
jgi:acyl-CoA thioesterase YciA